MIDIPWDRDRIEFIKTEVRTCTGAMYQYARFLCRDRRLAEDITQNAWVTIFKSLANPDQSTPSVEGANESAAAAIHEPIRNFKAYARRCVFNAFVDYLRAAGTRTGIGEVLLPEDEGHRIFRIDDKASEIVSSLDLRNALLQLDEEDRALVYLKYYKGYETAEAALEATGLTGSAAYRRHKAVLRRLRELLTTEEASD
jgi:RNA polymerase sigma factor (sigma-70 family)